MTKLLVANWKLHPLNEREAVALAKKSDAPNVVICPPFVYLAAVRKILNSHSSILHSRLGAQDAFWEEKGAYTGEVSPMMLKKMGVQYVILGHSERRRYFHETDEMINKKVLAALFAGLKVILCVGESKRGLRSKNGGLREAKAYVRKQLEKDLRGLTARSSLLHSRLIVAYEPIWAISTSRSGLIDTPEDAARMADFIKKLLATRYSLRPRVLYGGSVTSKNLKRFITRNSLDGALVGGASVKANEMRAMIRIARGG